MYIKILDKTSNLHKILEDINVVRRYLITVEQLSLSTSANLTSELLANFDIYKLNIIDDESIESRYERYYSVSYGELLNEGDVYSIRKFYTLDKTLVNAHWDELREQRNKELYNTDWVVSSPDITTSCKSKYNAYRQLLRIIDLVEFPVDYVFPEKPALEIVNTNYLLSEDNIDRLKTFRPIKEPELYQLFLDRWSRYGYTNRSEVVGNLLTLTTGREITDIL